MSNVMVTGHRPQRIPGELTTWVIGEMERVVDKLVDSHGMDFGITGMQRGVDLWFGELLIERDIPFAAYIPWPEWDAKWWGQYRRAHKFVADHAEVTHYVSQTYYQGVYWRRNQMMVDACDMGIAVWDGSPNGGTYDAMIKLERARKPYVCIDLRSKSSLLRTAKEREEVGASA